MKFSDAHQIDMTPLEFVRIIEGITFMLFTKLHIS